MMYRQSLAILFCLLTLLLHTGNLAAECIVGDCMNGHGSYRYKNGNVYTGDFREGKRHGQGVLEFKSGNRYDGEWRRDKMTGQATHTWAAGKSAGDKYIGQFVNGRFHGIGTYIDADGSRYEGEWKDRKRTGYGIFTFATGSKDRYIGQYVDGKRHGMGTYYFESGNKFEGEWRNGKRYGLGLYTWGSGKSKGKRFLGYYENGKRHGPGTYYDTDGGTRNVYYQSGKRSDERGQSSTTVVPSKIASQPLSDEQNQLLKEFGEPPHFDLFLVDGEGTAAQRNETWYYPALHTYFTFVDGRFAASGPIEQPLPETTSAVLSVSRLGEGLSPEAAAQQLVGQSAVRLDMAPGMLDEEIPDSMVLLFSPGLVLGFSNGRLAIASTLPAMQQLAQEVQP